MVELGQEIWIESCEKRGIAVRLYKGLNIEFEVVFVEVRPGRMDRKRHAKRGNSCRAVKVT